MQIDRNNAYVHSIIGAIFLRRRNAYAAAKAHFERAVRIDPHNKEYQGDLQCAAELLAEHPAQAGPGDDEDILTDGDEDVDTIDEEAPTLHNDLPSVVVDNGA